MMPMECNSNDLFKNCHEKFSFFCWKVGSLERNSDSANKKICCGKRVYVPRVKGTYAAISYVSNHTYYMAI